MRNLLAVGAAMLTVLVMLCLVTGSILVPVKALLVNVLSVAACLGVVLVGVGHDIADHLRQAPRVIVRSEERSDVCSSDLWTLSPGRA